MPAGPGVLGPGALGPGVPGRGVTCSGEQPSRWAPGWRSLELPCTPLLAAELPDSATLSLADMETRPATCPLTLDARLAPLRLSCTPLWQRNSFSHANLETRPVASAIQGAALHCDRPEWSKPPHRLGTARARAMLPRPGHTWPALPLSRRLARSRNQRNASMRDAPSRSCRGAAHRGPGVSKFDATGSQLTRSRGCGARPRERESR